MSSEIIAAIIGAAVGATVGALITYFLQKHHETQKEAHERRMQIFRLLISTRFSGAYHWGRIEALNMIPIDFPADNKKWASVAAAWREYLDSMTEKPGETDEARMDRSKTIPDRHVDLLHAMGVSLGYSFDKVMLKNEAYFPKGLADWLYAQELKTHLETAELLRDRKADNVS